MDDIKKNIEAVEAKVDEISFAMEMLQAMKKSDARKHVINIILAMMLFLSNAIWLYAWMQYDYVAYDTTTTTGIYNSLDGSIITTQDVDSITWERFMEWLNGETNKNADTETD